MGHHTPKLPSRNILRKLGSFTIDTKTGKVYNWDGRELGNKYKDGRILISVSTGEGVFEERRLIRRAHIIWWKATGRWPTLTIDHKNVKNDDDRIDNLREATMFEQNNNRSICTSHRGLTKF